MTIWFESKDFVIKTGCAVSSNYSLRENKFYFLPSFMSLVFIKINYQWEIFLTCTGGIKLN